MFPIGPVCRLLHSFAVHCLLNTLFTTETVHRPQCPILVSDVWRFISLVAGFAIPSTIYSTPNTLGFERNFRQRRFAIRPCPVECGNVQCIRQNSNNDRRVYSSLLPVTRSFNNGIDRLRRRLVCRPSGRCDIRVGCASIVSICNSSLSSIVVEHRSLPVIYTFNALTVLPKMPGETTNDISEQQVSTVKEHLPKQSKSDLSNSKSILIVVLLFNRS